jgi:hypothetical protein
MTHLFDKPGGGDRIPAVVIAARGNPIHLDLKNAPKHPAVLPVNLKTFERRPTCPLPGAPCFQD